MHPRRIERLQASRIAVLVADEPWHTVESDGNLTGTRAYAQASRVSRHHWQKEAARAADLESTWCTQPNYSAPTSATAAAKMAHVPRHMQSREHAAVTGEGVAESASQISEAESRLRQAELVMLQQSSDIASLRMELNRMQRLLQTKSLTRTIA